MSNAVAVNFVVVNILFSVIPTVRISAVSVPNFHRKVTMPLESVYSLPLVNPETLPLPELTLKETSIPGLGELSDLFNTCTFIGCFRILPGTPDGHHLIV